MVSIPKKVTERLAAGLKQFQPILTASKARDYFNLHRGYWEAKDSGDKLDVEIRNRG